MLPDGRTARARGTDIGMTGTTGGRALWSQSIYENEFVKQGGVWKFKTMHVYPRFIVDAETGMGEGRASRAGTEPCVPSRPASDRAYGDLSSFPHCAVPLRSPGDGPSSAVSGGTKVARAPAC